MTYRYIQKYIQYIQKYIQYIQKYIQYYIQLYTGSYTSCIGIAGLSWKPTLSKPEIGDRLELKALLWICWSYDPSR